MAELSCLAGCQSTRGGGTELVREVDVGDLLRQVARNDRGQIAEGGDRELLVASGITIGEDV